MSSYKVHQRECVITRQGRANIYKQGNGFKYAITGYALFKDPNGWLYKKCQKSVSNNETETDNEQFDFTCLREFTLDDVKKNLNVIFKNVTYTYNENMHIPNQAQYDKAWANVEQYIFPIQHAYKYISNDAEENTNNNTYISYDVIINSKSIDVTDVSSDQTFDGIVFIAKPYKTEPQDDGLDILDPQKPVLFAIQYFPVDKIMILKDQKERLVMNIELHISYACNENGEDIIVNVSDIMPDDYNTKGRVQGLHLANDSLTNTVTTDAETYETTNKLFMANTPDGSDDPYDTFAKLNIMSQAKSNVSESVPQLMFSLANTKGNNSWNGQRLAFNYASGGQAALFRIYEMAAAGKQRINFEMLGANNLYKNVKGVYGNSFIYSHENEIPQSAFNNTYINADNNIIFPHKANELSFINSNYNVVNSGSETLFHQFPGANNITFMETDNTVISPYYSTYYTSSYAGSKGIKGNKEQITWTPHTVGGHLSHHFLLDSDYTFINGHNNSDFHGTYISSPSAKHVVSEHAHHDLEIGNMYGYTNGNSGNLIAIGRGLTYVKGQGDKILLGHFNMNDTDPNNVLVVGDGFLSDEYLQNISGMLEGSHQNDRFFAAFDGQGDMVNWYRHNLMTVNRKGWIGISDYAKPSNSARYGYSGITAYCDGAKYEIPFSAVYAKLNVYDAVKEFQTTINEYTNKVDAINNTMPTNRSIAISASTDLKEYFGDNISGISNNSIVNVTYVTTAASTAKAFTAQVSATCIHGQTPHTSVNTVSAYNSLQYLYLKDAVNNITGFLKINN